MRLTSIGLAPVLGSRCVSCGRAGPALCSACANECRRCAVSQPIHGIERTIAPWAYEGAPRELILALKLRGRRSAAEPLAHATARAAQRASMRAEVVTWVPGRRRDIRVRGYDHAEVLARGVAEILGLPAVSLVTRVADPPDQTSLGAEQRRRNLQGAFVATPWTGGPVVIVDDLVTTGATLAACAAALRTTATGGVEALAPCRA
ncbi:MAG: ComF family protein [Actinomycetota bacterium]